MSANKILTLINNSSSIAILTHLNMDGDSLGSALAMYLSLKKMTKDVTVIVEEAVQEQLKFLPDSGEICLFNGECSIDKEKKFDLVVAVDCSDMERLGKRVDIFKNAKVTANIDHHPSNTSFADINYVIDNASATGEIIFELVSMMGIAIDEDISTCIYTAIASDTGGFRFANTSASTHRIAASLIDNGINASKISSNLFENVSIEKLSLTAHILSRIEMHDNGKIAIITLSKDVIDKYSSNEEDLNGYSNLGRTIRGVEVALFLKEKIIGEIKVSMRARDKVDLSQIATKYGGGGHRRAAGFSYMGTIDECKNALLKEFLNLL